MRGKNTLSYCALIISASALIGCSDSSPPGPTLIAQESGTTVRLQAISVVSDAVVWASGLGGTVVRTTNGGQTWLATTVPGADSLQFRDIDAIDADTAYLLSSGGGESSRIYKTTDGGASWTLQYTNPDASGFFDCMAFWDSKHGAAYGDAVDGSLVLLTTSDGELWSRVPAEGLPAALPGEGGFAASGTCLVTHGDSTGWVGTGATSTARVLKTTDRGSFWAAYSTPIVSGSGTSGITTVGFQDGLLGMVAGGEISDQETHSNNVAVTADGGLTWELAGHPVMTGAIYGIAFVLSAETPTVVAVGPGGADYTRDNGTSWNRLDSLEYWSVGFSENGVGWAVGPEGRITKISFGLPSAENEVN
jgi:photosystem II stability/assembly factor-like uncharacterized protein